MSTTDADTTAVSTSPTITLPPGVSAGPIRQTSQTNTAGQVVQGVVMPLTLPAGGTTTIFIPNSVLAQGAAQIQATIDTQLAPLLLLPGQ